jgi:hypothetical protein
MEVVLEEHVLRSVYFPDITYTIQNAFQVAVLIRKWPAFMKPEGLQPL